MRSVIKGSMGSGPRQLITFGHEGQEQGNSLVCWRAATEARRSAAMAERKLGKI